jgi:hypothetical protein
MVEIVPAHPEIKYAKAIIAALQKTLMISL